MQVSSMSVVAAVMHGRSFYNYKYMLILAEIFEQFGQIYKQSLV